MLRLFAAFLAVLLAATAPALAQGKSKGKGADNPGQGNNEITIEEVIEGMTAGVLDSVLTEDERKIINGYFHEHPDAVGKVKPLPPGIRKKLARGGAMPPGIAKQVLPDGLHRRLPPRDGQHYEIVGTDVVLIQTATKLIVDVLKDVLRGS